MLQPLIHPLHPQKFGKKIRTIKGNKIYHTIPALERKNDTPVAELLVSTFQQISSNTTTQTNSRNIN